MKAIVELSLKDSLAMKVIAEQTFQDSSTMKTIAELTQRDSLAMKCLALLTMTFLPANAVAVSFPNYFHSICSSMNAHSTSLSTLCPLTLISTAGR